MLELAERLIDDEAAGATSSSSEANIPVAFRVCEKLRHPLTTLAGAAGFRSLLLRALTLAKREDPSLGTLRVNADGSLEDVEPNLDHHDAEGGALLVANLIELLFTFIGEALTLRLMHDVWPDISFDTLIAEGTETA
jgi:hypothetical protein